MDIEELNAKQIILLVLLVSFVTSIATGIVTVSLLSQAPPAITQTVNRVVERTVETIVPKDNGRVTTKETTVVVKEDDLITDSISGSLTRTGRIYADLATSSAVVALGAVLSQNVIVTDSSVAEGDHLVSIGNTSSVYTVVDKYLDIGIAILQPKATSTVTATFKIGDLGGVKLGQTAIALTSVTSERVAIGNVSAKPYLLDQARKDKQMVSVRGIETNIDSVLVPGVPLVNVFGDLIGISTGVSGKGSFIAASDIALVIAPSHATSTASH